MLKITNLLNSIKTGYFAGVTWVYSIFTKMGITRGHDKVLHFIVGLLAMVILMALLPKLWAVPIAMSLGFLKELLDWIISGGDNTRFGFFDMLFTMFGSFVGIVVYSLIKGALGIL